MALSKANTIALLPMAAVMWNAAARAAVVRRPDAAICDVTGSSWSYLDPVNFEGVEWNNWETCLYSFSRTSPTTFTFASPSGCLEDPWSAQNASGTELSNSGREIAIRFTTPVQVIERKGWVSPDCQYIDMDDGGLYIRGVHPMNMSPHEWLRAATAWVMRAAMITFEDGTRHLTPGVPKPVEKPSPNDGYYVGQWMRDGFYGISNGWDLVNESVQESFVASAEWMFSLPRSDGMLAESCTPSGHCTYGQTCLDQPPAANWQQCQTLDTCSFAVKLAAHLWNHMDEESAKMFYSKWVDTLERAMNATTKDPAGSGLLWSNTTRPQVGYGFQDAEIKSGNVLYSSILFWNASHLLADMATKQGDFERAERLRDQAAKVQSAASDQLWNASLGVYMASTEIESNRIDVWGNAMAGAVGFASPPQCKSIFEFFKTRENDIFYEGQVREIPYPDQWTDAVPGVFAPRASTREYQNGGFWATPHHHVLPFIAMFDRQMACRLLNSTIASFRGHGIWEWVGPFYPSKIVGAPGYTASAADTYFASEHLSCWL